MQRDGSNATRRPHGRRIWAATLLAALIGLALCATPALAAPEWGIEMTHANAYGLQSASCPGGHASLPGEPDCGVDPFTGSATAFDRESGFNAYTITVKNTASEGAGATFTCETGAWEKSPTFAYQWLRDGAAIVGATASSYTATAADEGKPIQCDVIASNSHGATSFASSALPIPPRPSTTPPAVVWEEEYHEYEGPFISKEFQPVLVGEKLSCYPGQWTGAPTSFAYQWLRNGTPIASASSNEYTLTAGDEGASVQCQVTATNGGGSVVATDLYPTVVSPGPKSKELPYLEFNEETTNRPTFHSSSGTSGAVSVADRLPAGLTLAGFPESMEVSGQGWSCTIADPRAFSCTRSDSLGPGEAYAPITLHAHVGDEAPTGTPPSGGVTSSATVSGGGAPSANVSDPTTIAAVPFGIDSFTASVTSSLGEPFTQAGGHPFAASATFVFNYLPDDVGHLRTAGGSPRDIETELPPGFVGDPQATPKCAAKTFSLRGQQPCPSDTAVGYVDFTYSEVPIVAGRPQPFGGYTEPRGFGSEPVYNLVPGPGHPAAFGFIGGVSEAHITLTAKVRSDGNYGITVSSPYTTTPTVLAVSLTFCESGVTFEGPVYASTESCAPTDAGATPFLTNPANCSSVAPVTTLRANSYEDPADYVSETVPTGTNLIGNEPNAESFVTGCDRLIFHPRLALSPQTSQADAPAGAMVRLKVPQPEEADTLATPELKDATVVLPAGLNVSPSAADGLQACSNAQFGLGATVEPASPAQCPGASQIGTVEVFTPLLANNADGSAPLQGEVFIGQPECDPCSNADAQDGRLFRLFMQLRDPAAGVIVKLPGTVSANAVTGQLTARFTEQPQLPFSELVLRFNQGARAPLATPQSCGTFTTASTLTPWSAPYTPDATSRSSFDINWYTAGGACPSSPAALPFAPSFDAGTQGTAAGAFSPFALTISRNDGEQDLSQVTVTTPPGLLAKIAGIPRCGEAQANAGTCGAESQIGTTTAGAGPGPHPFFLGGRVYLTGPYEGQPFGLSIVVPAIAGPFNLGDVVVRAAIGVDPHTAQITVSSDPLPQYVAGVQLRLRKIDAQIDRSGFMLNPTSCVQQHVSGTVAGAQGASVAVSSPFEVGGCQRLPFKPGFAVLTHAGHSRANGEYLHVAVTSGSGQANVAKVHVELPRQLPSRLSTLKLACTAAQFAANPAGCPPGSFVGAATAYTPVLSSPLSGPAIFVSHGGAAFPDLDLVLQGEGVTVILTGNTFISKAGITSSTFATVPDVPITRFDLVLPTGPHSALAANGNLCSRTVTTSRRVRVRVGGHLVYRTRRLRRTVKTALKMPTTITGQNGAVVKQGTVIAVSGCPALKGKAKGKGAKHGRSPAVKPKQSSNGKGRK